MSSPSISETADKSTKADALRLLARDIRALRKARGLTLSGLAEKLDRSVGWLSQVERGISLPSLADIRALANHFHVPVSLFLAEQEPVGGEYGVIVRADRRRVLGTSDSGLVEELLSPDLGGSFEIIRSVFAPGTEQAEARHRGAEEAGYLVSGTLELEIGGVSHELCAGDSFRFRKEPLRWRNRGTEPAVVIWVVSPPVY